VRLLVIVTRVGSMSAARRCVSRVMRLHCCCVSTVDDSLCGVDGWVWMVCRGVGGGWSGVGGLGS
jgi:hypothetical protein